MKKFCFFVLNANLQKFNAHLKISASQLKILQMVQKQIIVHPALVPIVHLVEHLEMTKFFIFTLYFLFFFPNILFAQNIDSLQLIYKKAETRLQFNALEDSIFAYKSTLIQFNKLLGSSAPPEIINKTIPYAAASSYRLGFITPKYVLGNFNKLYNSLTLYGETEKWINEINAKLADLKAESQITLAPNFLDLLLLAKAYNKICWANTSYSGISWKRYYICRPQETAAMVESAVKDIKKIFSDFGITESNQIEMAISNFTSSLSQNSTELATLSLIASSTDKTQINKFLIKHLNYAFTVTEVYDRELMPVFKKASFLHTFEDYLKEASLSKEISQAFEKIIDSSGIKEL
jgi:hypothetical protein